MKKLSAGSYIGENLKTIQGKHFILTLNRYKENIDSGWHTHQNPFFALILKGGNLEQRKRMDIESSPGTLLFYNADELHCNRKYKSGSVNFHVEFDPLWFKSYDIGLDNLNIPVQRNSQINVGFHKIIREFESLDNISNIVIEGLLLQSIGELTRHPKEKYHLRKPEWLETAVAFLYENTSEKISYGKLAIAVGVHPSTLSKLFPKYYHCTIGEYTRKLRVQKSLNLLNTKCNSIADISDQCGFYDSSHFIKAFKNEIGCTPSIYRNLL
jgi:AraC-like DNA-binding protein